MGFFNFILRQYGHYSVTLLKTWASNNRKIASLTNRRVFLLRCRKEEITPQHIEGNINNIKYILTYNNNQENETINRTLQHLRRQLISIEISTTITNLRHLENVRNEIKQKIVKNLPFHIYHNFFIKQNIAYNKIYDTIKLNNKNKFENLYQKYQLKYKIPTNNKWLINLSNTNLPENVTQILALGPKYVLPPQKQNIHIGNIISSFEQALQNVTHQSPNFYRNKFTNILTNYINSKTPQNQHIINKYKQTKTFLKNNKHLLVLTSDKGNVTVIMNQQDYDKRAKDILNNPKYYKQIKKDPTSTVQNNTNKLIHENFVMQNIDKKTCTFLKTYNGIAPRFFGQPKYHKEGTPLRPVISTIGSPTYNLSKHISQILTSAYNTNNTYYTEDTYTFVKFINNKTIQSNYELVSFDVISLFNNITLQDTIEAINLKWDDITNKCKYSKQEFNYIIEHLFNNSYFTYNKTFYKQICGTPMGANVSSIIAQYVMDLALDRIIQKLNFQIPFIKKFVDDIITAIPKNNIQTTLNTFNSYNNNIQFTIEREENNSLPFLDTKVIRTNNNTLITDWYQKPIASGRYIHYQSYLPKTTKINFIKSMIQRIITISHQSFHKQNLNKLQQLLNLNGYPTNIVHTIINSIKTNNPHQNQQQRKYITFPYIPHISHKITKLLKNENIILANKPVTTIKTLYSNTKDPIELLLNSNIVYQLNCTNCSKIYIGHTSQYLKSRITLHKSDAKLRPERCALAHHTHTLKHTFNFEKPIILHKEINTNKRIFLETYYINKYKQNTINYRQDTQNINIIYNNVFSH